MMPYAPNPTQDAREMVRRYGARQARRQTAVSLSVVGGVGLIALAAVTLARRRLAHQHVGGVARRVAERVGGFRAVARTQASRAGQAAPQFVQEPLVVAALSLATGLAASAIWPPTQTERRLMGPMRGRLLERASDLASEAADEVVDAVKGVVTGLTSQEQPAKTTMNSQAGRPAADEAAPARPSRRRRATGAPT